ncbi:MAG: CopG family ribbon-helix-helix protein [Acidilobus sp.]
MGKTRFGISIPEKLSRDLDQLADRVNLSRSELVEQAIRNMLTDYIHYLVPHDCEGVMVAVCPESKGSETVVEEFSDVAGSYLHVHQRSMCYEVLMVSGPSKRISELHGRLAALGCGVRFLPSRSLEEYAASRLGRERGSREG